MDPQEEYSRTASVVAWIKKTARSGRFQVLVCTIALVLFSALSVFGVWLSAAKSEVNTMADKLIASQTSREAAPFLSPHLLSEILAGCASTLGVMDDEVDYLLLDIEANPNYYQTLQGAVDVWKTLFVTQLAVCNPAKMLRIHH